MLIAENLENVENKKYILIHIHIFGKLKHEVYIILL